ncbi:MAG TPA: hypothetical protein VGP13_00025 [Candidatus Paceibacterota bacterium]|jgi:hypothetical protein|nr:hypothetical protein [Candidatus Paceibacterota bacterium]
MVLAGELISLLVSLAQEIGIVLGVGALTITLIGHLLSLHAHIEESTLAYIRAARQVRAVALAIIILSGLAAVLIHFQSGTLAVAMGPAFVGKWIIIGILTAFYFWELDAKGLVRDGVEGFEGANWYALFIVHTVAPVIGWTLLGQIYAGWLVAFAIVWAAFVWFMRRQTTIKPAAVGADVSTSRRSAEVKNGDGGASAPKAPVAMPKSIPAPILKPTPVPASKVEVMPNHTLLPMVAELDLPAPKSPVATMPPVAPKPMPQSTTPIIPKPQAEVKMTDLNAQDSNLPALRVMPQKPEDIASSNRPSPVKFDEGQQ